MRFRFSILFVILLQWGHAFGQETGNAIESSVPAINVSYHGNNFWNPGLNVGVEQAWATTRRVNRKNRNFTVEKLLYVDLGFFRDFSRQTPVFTHFGVMRRRYKESGFHTQWGVSPLGVMRSFLPETWSYQSGGGAEQVRFAGRWYYAPVVSWGIGRLRDQQVGTGWFVELNMTVLFPYNRSLMSLLNCKAGYRFPLNRQLLPLKPKES